MAYLLKAIDPDTGEQVLVNSTTIGGGGGGGDGGQPPMGRFFSLGDNDFNDQSVSNAGNGILFRGCEFQFGYWFSQYNGYAWRCPDQGGGITTPYPFKVLGKIQFSDQARGWLRIKEYFAAADDWLFEMYVQADDPYGSSVFFESNWITTTNYWSIVFVPDGELPGSSVIQQGPQATWFNVHSLGFPVAQDTTYVNPVNSGGGTGGPTDDGVNNYTKDTALPITIGSSTNIVTSNVKWYSFTVPADQQVYIYTRDKNGQGSTQIDTDICLFDTVSGNILMQNEDENPYYTSGMHYINNTGSDQPVLLAVTNYPSSFSNGWNASTTSPNTHYEAQVHVDLA